ncbi:hypothetical protein M407DRAFT_19203 [Tulasnella calospora MUT 4182]|uniref:Uncharacterized protein n=1 Tax=Tulasnella calospora MUT 4182 TaxID=1051891 RepID=A0A0C3MDW0_9AGAM|nr:hypothetical protein M407DRAFT_19203 [Tulasnella calospora MUT 4182]
MFAKLFETRTTEDSVATLTARPTLFNQALCKLKTALKRFSKDKKTALHVEEPNSQRRQNIESQVQTSQAHLSTEDIIVPSACSEATTSISSSRSPSPLNWAPPLGSLPSSAITTPPPSPPPTTTPPTASCPKLLFIRSRQATLDLAAANKRVVELEATIARRKFDHESYVQRIEKWNLPGRIKRATEERDLFNSRIKRAEEELAQKTAERLKMEEEWFDERQRRTRIIAQLILLAAKIEVGESAKEYAELEAKYLKLQSQLDSVYNEADHQALDSEGSAANDGGHQGRLSAGPCPSQ